MTNKTYRFAAVAVVLLTLSLVFAAPVSAEGEVTNESAIGSVEYPTLAEAILEAADGQTVTLLRDVSSSEIIVIDKAITLDGAGYTLKNTAEASNVVGVINVSCDGDVTIKDLILQSNNPSPLVAKSQFNDIMSGNNNNSTGSLIVVKVF